MLLPLKPRSGMPIVMPNLSDWPPLSIKLTTRPIPPRSADKRRDETCQPKSRDVKRADIPETPGSEGARRLQRGKDSSAAQRCATGSHSLLPSMIKNFASSSNSSGTETRSWPPGVSARQTTFLLPCMTLRRVLLSLAERIQTPRLFCSAPCAQI